MSLPQIYAFPLKSWMVFNALKINIQPKFDGKSKLFVFYDVKISFEELLNHYKIRRVPYSNVLGAGRAQL